MTISGYDNLQLSSFKNSKILVNFPNVNIILHKQPKWRTSSK